MTRRIARDTLIGLSLAAVTLGVLVAGQLLLLA